MNVPPRGCLLVAALTVAGCNPPDQPAIVSEAVVATAVSRSVTIYFATGDQAKGSGILLDARGYVVTANHVVEHRKDVLRVALDGHTLVPAFLQHAEPRLDLALLRTGLRRSVPRLRLLDRSEVRVGEPIFLVGAPYGLVNSFLTGTVSHTERTDAELLFAKVPFIQTLGVSFPGCSGAGVYARSGRLIGINRATYGFGAGNGIGLVIPAGFLRVFLRAARMQGVTEE